MTVYVFTGPTISASAVREQIDAVCLPPAAGGDLYRVARTHPTAIGLIDGYLERMPSVWHKEILWAMAQGVHVFGAAAMGALRAAELEAFGMEGVGLIFDAYRDGSLQDDDEVIIAHAGEDEDYRALSEAMVNIRATLAAAESGSVISSGTRQMLEAAAKDLFYPQRTYEAMLQHPAPLGADARETARLREWLPAGRVDQTHADAVVMLGYIRKRIAQGLTPKEVTYRLERTEYWERIRQQADSELDPAQIR